LREVLSNCGARQNVRAINKGIKFIYEFDEEMVLFECDEKNISKAFSIRFIMLWKCFFHHIQIKPFLHQIHK
ncbi:hypothetical protein, partial [Clostridioides difficile]|uniref:hypothetical protein n=1 Tax=Clostridioides difficile TaxID=1496 RepID=UPI0018DE7277